MSDEVDATFPGLRTSIRWTPVTAGLAIGAVVLAYRTWQLAQAYFWQDDFVYLHRADTSPLDAGYLLQDYNGHLMPGAFLVAKAVVQLGDHRWLAAASVVLVLEVAKVLLAVGACIQLFGQRWGTVIPIAGLLMTPMWVTPTLWWAAALQSLPLQVSLLASIWLAARYLAAPRWQLLGWVSTALILGLAFWEKAIVVPPAALATVALVEMCREPGGPLLRALWRVLKRLRAVIATWLGVLAAYTPLFLSRVDLAHQVPSPASAGDRISALRHASVAFVTGLAGGPWRATEGTDTLTPNPASGAVLVAVQLVALGVVVLFVVGGSRRVLAALLVSLAFFLADTAAVTLTRLGLAGPAAATDPRYFTEAVIVTVLAVGACLLTVRLDENPRLARVRGRGPVLVGASVLLFANSAAITQQALTDVAGRRESGAFAAEARSQIHGMGRVEVYDGPVPDGVIWSLFKRDARMSRVFSDHRLPIRWNESTSDLRMFNGLGMLRPADLKDVVADAGKGPQPECGWPASPGRPARVSFPQPIQLDDRPVMFAYFTDRPGEVDITLGGRTQSLVVEQGLNRLWVFAPGQTVRDMELSRVQGGTVCVTEVKVGTVWPKA